MNVLLINPNPGKSRMGSRRYKRAWPPLDLLIAGAMLDERGHYVSLIDARAVEKTPEEIAKTAQGFDLIFLQSTPLDRWQCPDLNWESLVGLARILPSGKLVLGGVHGALRPELMLKKTNAGCLIRGEPETALLELVEAGGHPHGLKGTSYFDSGRIVHEPDHPLQDLSQFPSPKYELLDLADYRYELLGPRLALLETSRGCPFRCTFCLKTMYGSGMRTKPLDSVLSEVEEVLVRHRAENIYFIDLEFGLDREFTAELCRNFLQSGFSFRWCCQTRADTVDADLLELMKKAGCALIHFGVETGSPRLLEETRKNITVEQIRTVLEHCRRLGINTTCFFLMGLPGETESDRRATIAVARELNPSFASFHVAAPYPGTEMGLLSDGKDPFPVCLDGEHDFDQLGRMVRRAYLDFYLRPSYLLSRLKEGTLKDKLGLLKLFWEFMR